MIFKRERRKIMSDELKPYELSLRIMTNDSGLLIKEEGHCIAQALLNLKYEIKAQVDKSPASNFFKNLYYEFENIGSNQ
jgi:hypothetical protein